jgi:hypothetical protein
VAYIPDEWVIKRVDVPPSGRDVLFYYCARANQDTGETNVSPQKVSQDLGIRKDHVDEHDRKLSRLGLITISNDEYGGRIVILNAPWKPRAERQQRTEKKVGSQVLGKKLKLIKADSQNLGSPVVTPPNLGESAQNLGTDLKDFPELGKPLPQNLGENPQNLGLHIRNNQPINQHKNTGADSAGSLTAQDCHSLFCRIRADVGGYEAPYQDKRADFIQLNDLLKKSAAAHWPITPARFTQAAGHYFATPLSAHTLADLAVRFSTFFKHALDKFGKPIESVSGHNGIGHSGNGGPKLPKADPKCLKCSGTSFRLTDPTDAHSPMIPCECAQTSQQQTQRITNNGRSIA